MLSASIIMNSYRNSDEYLKQAISSYKTQENASCQIIVSTVEGDSAIRVAKEMGVEVVVSSTGGIYSQINAAIPNVKEDWFCYASGNDVALPNKIHDEIRNNLNIKKEVCYSAYYKCDGNLNKISTQPLPSAYVYKNHLKRNYVSDVSMVSSRLLMQFSPFVLKFGNHAFWDFWLRIAEKEGNVFCYNNTPTWLYRIEDISQHVVRSKNKARQKENEKSKIFMLKNHGVKA